MKGVNHETGRQGEEKGCSVVQLRESVRGCPAYRVRKTDTAELEE